MSLLLKILAILVLVIIHGDFEVSFIEPVRTSAFGGVEPHRVWTRAQVYWYL